MKLFLLSEDITYEQAPTLIQLVGKPANETKVAIIENAADVESNTSWVDEYRAAIVSIGFKVEQVDLNKFKDSTRKESLMPILRDCDVIWLGGGNTYYLRWLLKETRADVIIQGLVKNGKVYAGSSAGAIIAGPTLKCFEPADEPNKAPEIILGGLNLTDTVVIPHWNDEKYGPIVKKAEEELKRAGYKTLHIDNEQVLVIDGELHSVIP